VDRSPTSGFASNFKTFFPFPPAPLVGLFSLSPLLGVNPSIPERYLKSLRSDPTEKAKKKRRKKKPH
jgi:hypothetical protein